MDRSMDGWHAFYNSSGEVGLPWLEQKDGSAWRLWIPTQRQLICLHTHEKTPGDARAIIICTHFLGLLLLLRAEGTEDDLVDVSLAVDKIMRSQLQSERGR